MNAHSASASTSPAATGDASSDVAPRASRLPVYAISHGGGPWPWMIDGGGMPVDWNPLRESLAAIPTDLAEPPRAVLMVTAHWETRGGFMVQGNPTPPMIYDYGGFPAHTYNMQYPAPGEPEVARRVADLLGGAELPVRVDPERGFDHGTFVPAYVMYPEAEVPIVQLSIERSFDPALHLSLGRALAPLRDENVLIVGSGLPTYHDLSSFGPPSAEPSRNFDEWLTHTMVDLDGVGGDRRRSGQVRLAGLAHLCHEEQERRVVHLVSIEGPEPSLERHRLVRCDPRLRSTAVAPDKRLETRASLNCACRMNQLGAVPVGDESVLEHPEHSAVVEFEGALVIHPNELRPRCCAQPGVEQLRQLPSIHALLLVVDDLVATRIVAHTSRRRAVRDPGTEHKRRGHDDDADPYRDPARTDHRRSPASGTEPVFGCHVLRLASPR